MPSNTLQVIIHNVDYQFTAKEQPEPVDYTHPVVQSVLQPMAVAFALTGGINLALRSRWGARLASAAIATSLLIAILQLLGMPPWLPRTGMQKLSYLVFLGL